MYSKGYFITLGVGIVVNAISIIFAYLIAVGTVLLTFISFLVVIILLVSGSILIIVGLMNPKQQSDAVIMYQGWRYPNINIWDAKTVFHDYRDDKTRERDVVSKTYDIWVKIANCGDDNAREPYWVWRLTLDNKKSYVGKLKDAEPKIKIGASYHKISYIPHESQTFFLKDISGLDDIKERKQMKTLEIWVVYPTRYRKRVSYQIFYNENDKWITKKITKIYWVKK